MVHSALSQRLGSRVSGYPQRATHARPSQTDATRMQPALAAVASALRSVFSLSYALAFAVRLCGFACAPRVQLTVCGPVRACAGAARASGGALGLRRCAGGAVSAVIRQQCALKCLTGRSCSRALHSAATVRGKWCKCIAAHSRMQGSDGSDSSSISSTSKPSRRRGRPQPQAQAQLSLMLMLSSRLCCSDTDSVRWALLGLTSTPPPFHR